MIKEVAIFILGCFLLVKSAEYAVKSVAHLARYLRLTEFVTSFILVAFVSSLPEGFISIIAAFEGEPSIGVGTLLGGNIADLTLILGLVALAGHPVRIHSSIIKKDLYFAVLMLLPILREREYFHKPYEMKDHWIKHLGIFVVCIAVMLLSAHFIVGSTQLIAIGLGVPTLLIGLVVVALGTTLPEFTFSLQSVRSGHADLAIGDLLGTVVVDATIIMGITALIYPIAINVFILSIIGIFTLFAVVFSLLFMRTDGILSKNEAMALILFYVAFVVAQLFLH
jgi:cation:H+ antiporter